jgi:NADH dehydrogenase
MWLNDALMESPIRRGAHRRPGVAGPHGTVAVTGATRHVARRLLERLAGLDVFSVALTREPGRLAAKLVVAGAPIESLASEALEDADQVVHLAGDLRPRGESYWDANVAAAEAVARAARRGLARRIVFLSDVGVVRPANNEYLETLAEAERILGGAGCELVVFRATHVVGPPREPGPLVEALRPNRDGIVLVPGYGTQPIAPVLLDDVVGALMAALHGGPPGTYELAGPEEMAFDDLVALVNRVGVVVRHVPARIARLAAKFVPSLPVAAVDVLLRASLGDAREAARAFGLTFRSVRRAWAG